MPAPDAPPNLSSAKDPRAPWDGASSPAHPSSQEIPCSRSAPSPSPQPPATPWLFLQSKLTPPPSLPRIWQTPTTPPYPRQKATPDEFLCPASFSQMHLSIPSNNPPNLITAHRLFGRSHILARHHHNHPNPHIESAVGLLPTQPTPLFQILKKRRYRPTS